MQVLPETQRIKIAKWIDEYAGRWLIRLVCWLQPAQPRQHETATVNRILFVKFWGIGSIILAEPTLRYWRKIKSFSRSFRRLIACFASIFAICGDLCSRQFR